MAVSLDQTGCACFARGDAEKFVDGFVSGGEVMRDYASGAR